MTGELGEPDARIGNVRALIGTLGTYCSLAMPFLRTLNSDTVFVVSWSSFLRQVGPGRARLL